MKKYSYPVIIFVSLEFAFILLSGLVYFTFIHPGDGEIKHGDTVKYVAFLPTAILGFFAIKSLQILPKIASTGWKKKTYFRRIYLVNLGYAGFFSVCGLVSYGISEARVMSLTLLFMIICSAIGSIIPGIILLFGQMIFNEIFNEKASD